MNDLTKLLEQLSQKLGTTTEYLWGVLIKQAHISATINLLQTIAVFVFGYGLYKIHRKLLKPESNDRHAETGYSKYQEGAAIPMIIAGIIFTIMAIACFCCLEDIFNGYFNPEYWALDKILDKIK